MEPVKPITTEVLVVGTMIEGRSFVDWCIHYDPELAAAYRDRFEEPAIGPRYENWLVKQFEERKKCEEKFQ